MSDTTKTRIAAIGGILGIFASIVPGAWLNRHMADGPWAYVTKTGVMIAVALICAVVFLVVTRVVLGVFKDQMEDLQPAARFTDETALVIQDQELPLKAEEHRHG